MSRNILLIDKDPAIIDVISLILEEEGYSVLISKKPFNLQEVIHHQPALILLHNGLNNEGSFICQSIKYFQGTNHIPVIMSSTRPDLADISKKSSADAYIQKPFDIEDFLALIKKTLIGSESKNL
ncbi:Response regulator receiver domain-containing protein [Pedobacter westerhofensis]|uniref:Response regulator receiver domain-containing protein n=1 Tax=Pedobacter westerhofensis TaxID=425512 RepID=A0A521BCE8_9SPHI|nr:response regulator [Pedobacter westerhofensis]SMO44420.1 Response regulator receiver domain-containing protein [Pedobacter westerhofensis]